MTHGAHVVTWPLYAQAGEWALADVAPLGVFMLLLTIRSLSQRGTAECRDALECVLLPGLAVALPWRWAFRLFRWLARWPMLYRVDTEQAVAQALVHGLCTPQTAALFAWERRLVQLVDHADHYLYRTRSRRWLNLHVDIVGTWQDIDRAGMLWTFHWGAGMWALLHARKAGMRAQMVLAAPQGPDFVGRLVFSHYIRSRLKSVQQALGRPTVFVPGAMAGIRAAIARDEQLVVVMDVPEDRVGPVRLARLRLNPVSVPAALPNMAVELGLPVTVFTMGLDVVTGRRQLRMVSMGVHSDPQALSDAVFAELDALLDAQPAAWHLWAQAPRFLRVRAVDNPARPSA